ncbi:hypothetical protein FOMPIDRAFT_1123372, partial [Fomitopsis schrenkii]
IGLPHTTNDDDVYRGYWIPKGTNVFPNIWGMLHDAETYRSPERFYPERFDGVHGNETDPQGIVFGYGRR